MENSMIKLIAEANRYKTVIFDHVIRAEGGYVNDPDDNGGPTRYGVTQTVWTNFCGTDPSHEDWPTDVKDISKEMAKAYYDHRFSFMEMWRLPAPLWNSVFDFEVNAGRNAIKVMQEMAREHGLRRNRHEPIEVDGIIGPLTEGGVNRLHWAFGTRHFLYQYTARRMAYYLTLTEKNPKYDKYLAGWLNRSRKSLERSMAMCDEYNLGLPS